MQEEKLYAKRNHEALGQHFLNHMSAMTGENLQGKFEIAAELAWRDKEIERLKAIHTPEGTNKFQLTIALDYDGTVTSDYDGFTNLALRMKERGHKVYIVTMRYKSECFSDPKFMKLARMLDGYIPTNRMAKKKVCEAMNIQVDIWIDDNPEAVYKSAMEIWGNPSPEGSVVIEKHGVQVIQN